MSSLETHFKTAFSLVQTKLWQKAWAVREMDLVYAPLSKDF